MHDYIPLIIYPLEYYVTEEHHVTVEQYRWWGYDLERSRRPCLIHGLNTCTEIMICREFRVGGRANGRSDNLR